MRTRQMRFAAGGMALLLGLAACGGGDGDGGESPGVTDTTITIGSTQPLTGPAAPGYSQISQASEAYFKYINDNGGINGRTITYNYVDDGYDPTKTVSQTRKLVQQDEVFAIFNALGTPTHEKVVDYLNTNKVPDLFVASGCLCWDDPETRPYTFGWQTNYTVEGKILGNYVAENFADKKVAYFYQDDDFGQDGIAGLDKEIDPASVVAKESYQTSNPDIADQVSTFQSKQADVIVAFSIPAFTALLKLNALKIGYNPQIVVSNVGSDPTTLTGLLEAFAKQGGSEVKGNDLIQGIITDAYLATPADPDNSWIKLFTEIHDKYIADLPLDGNVLYGMAAAYTFAQALKAAGENPTRQSLVDAVEAGLPQGPGLVPFRYSEESHDGFTGAQIGIIKGTAVELQGSPLTTDDGDGAIEEYSGTQPEAPSDGIPPE